MNLLKFKMCEVDVDNEQNFNELLSQARRNCHWYMKLLIIDICLHVDSASLNKFSIYTTFSSKPLDSPNVTVYQNDYTVHCKAKGNPNNISFVAWQHYSEFGNIIMSVKGSELLDINSNKRYATNGIYTCDATNGIPDISGNTVKSGKYSVQVNGIPEVLPNTQMIQYGKYREPLEVILFVYSVPPITTTGIYKPKTNVLETGNVTCVYRNLTIIPFENQIVLKGYEIRLQIHSLTKTDLGNYTFVIENKKGKTNCTILVLDKDFYAPCPPLIKSVSSIDSDVLVSFQQTSNDGLLQQFVVEYRKVYENTWTSAYTINNTLTEPYSVTIHGLEYGVEYCVQVYGINDAGRGNSTEVCSMKTANNSTYVYTLIMLPVSITFLCAYFGLRKRKKIQNWILRLRSSRNSSSHLDNDRNEQELQESPPLDSPHMMHNEMYAMPNRNLAYVELDLSENTGRFHIRGEERTNYSDIEYFRVGPPASSSSSEDGDDDGGKDNDDFMSIEEIANMMKSRGADAQSDCD